MYAQPAYKWIAKGLITRLLLVQAVLIIVLGLDLTRPVLLLLYAGLLVAAFLVWLAFARPCKMRLGGTGCLMVTVVLLISAALKCTSWLHQLVRLPSAGLAEHASALFTLVILLGPITHHWRILEECYYQVYLASRLKRDLGFESTTNTLWPDGIKYLFFTDIQTGGPMDQAGFLPYDIVVDQCTFTEFWRRLEEARGGAPVPIAVASWADSGPVSKRPTRQLCVRVPRKNYSAALEEELGFRCALAFVKESGNWNGVVLVKSLSPGGLMERAGFRERDIFLDVGGVPHLFERLEQARGLAPVTLEVVPWLDPSDLAERPVRELLLEVPPSAKRRSRNPWAAEHMEMEKDLQRELGFKAGWERLPHQGRWHGWPTVEDLQPDGILARAGFREKDILLEGFSWGLRWHKARGQEPITVKVVSWMEPVPVRERVRRRLSLFVPPPGIRRQ
jgi:hypothetical protein